MDFLKDVETVKTAGALPEDMQMPVQDPDKPENAAVIASVSERPSFAALGFSRLLSWGAPVCSCGEVPDEFRGRIDYLETPGFERMPVQYAAVEADRLLSRAIPDDLFSCGRAVANEEPLLVVSGFLRAVGIEKAYRYGTASAYRKQLVRDAELLQMKEETVAAMHAPVLIRLIGSERVSPALAESSNRKEFDLKKHLEAVLASLSEKKTPPAPPPEFVPSALQTLWLGENGEPLLSSKLEFLRRFPEEKQKKLFTEDGFPNAEAEELFLATELRGVFGESADPLLSAARTESAERVLRMMLASIPFCTVLQKAGESGMTRFLRGVAEFAGASPDCLASGNFSGLAPEGREWLRLVLESEASRAKIREKMKKLSARMRLRALKRARSALSREVCGEFMTFLQPQIPDQLDFVLEGLTESPENT